MSREHYTVNEVEARTKVPASTLRQWERRYGFPKPERSASGYRLYRDVDIRNIEQMKRHIAAGMSASRAAELVCPPQRAEGAPSGSLEGLYHELLGALLELSETRADRVFSQAHSFHSVEDVLSVLAERTMRELGAMWHEGRIPVTTEHFASAYIQGRLRGLMGAAPNAEGGAVVVVACAPLEMHELGALVLAVLLRRAGFHVLYLGANTPVKDLRDLTLTLRPAGVMISASVAPPVEALFEARAHLVGMAPVLAFGGAAFDGRPELAAALHGTFLAPDAKGAVRRFSRLVQQAGALHA